MNAEERAPHAVLDLRSRALKARKIERLLGLEQARAPLRLLEVGTGSGGIAHYFATQAPVPHRVTAVDVHDNRLVHDGYAFHPVSGETLPFEDASFDVVLSNHVVEHVGDLAAQRRHLAELRRVLAPEGVGYLAVPSRWQVIEPHFKLAFLSWLPPSLADRYVRAARRGTHYDCRPLRPSQAEALLEEAGFEAVQQHGNALRATFELERPGSRVQRLVSALASDAACHPLRRAFPTLIYVLHPRRAATPPPAAQPASPR